MTYLDISPDIRQLGREAEQAVRPYFDRIDAISEHNTEKVLAAFAKNHVAEAMPAPPAMAMMTRAGIRWIRFMRTFSERKLLWCASALSMAPMLCAAPCFPQ